jgi:hypothetical protein
LVWWIDLRGKRYQVITNLQSTFQQEEESRISDEIEGGF